MKEAKQYENKVNNYSNQKETIEKKIQYNWNLRRMNRKKKKKNFEKE